MSSNYKTESDLFRSNFEHIKHKRIVIYGIGRYTATLMPEIPDFNVVGFMDRDQDKIGTLIYGLPILKKEDAEAKADLVIINTVESYWKTIFARIQDIQLPVYYRNGSRASLEFNHNEKLKYWETSYEELAQKAKEYDIVSFDIFDTLFMRKTYLPKDNWDVIGKQICSEWGERINFCEMREQAAHIKKNENKTLDEIYETLAENANWSKEKTARIKEIELEVELKSLVPRNDVVKLCKSLMDMGKQVFFISDMYLPSEWIACALKKAGIICDVENIWVSCEIKASKSNGSLWRLYKEHIVKEKRALHIGDNKEADIRNAEREGIDTFYVMPGRDMLSYSSMKNIESKICSLAASQMMGLIISRLLNSPFCLNENCGKIQFKNPEDFGYCVYGPVIHTFLVWLIQRSLKDGKDQLLFVARDGYFLSEDYNFLVDDLLQQKKDCPKGMYLLISRRIVLSAMVSSKADFDEFAYFPFNGTFSEYMFTRFGIESLMEKDAHTMETITLPGDKHKVEMWILPYMEQIERFIHDNKREYLQYLDSCKISSNAAIVDTWYYGNTQYCFNKLRPKKIDGYYFAANLSPQNRCYMTNKMTACFQRKDDHQAKESNLFKKASITESLLTAPYGMIQMVWGDGRCFCLELKNNQKYFSVKERINDGIKEFMVDFWQGMKHTKITELSIDAWFTDQLFGCWFENGCELSQDIKDSFWTDNAMVQGREFKIFE